MSERNGKSIRSGMSKKLVEGALAETMAPILQQSDFEYLKRGNARRSLQQRIDVIQVEFFNKSSHMKWGTTPYSFALPIGFFIKSAPSFYSSTTPKDAFGNPVPEPAICHVRGTPKKRIRQRECDIPNIWYVDPDGKSLDKVLNDVRNVLVTDVIPWFERLGDLNVLLNMLLEDPEERSVRNNCWGWGRMNSPVRLALTGFVAFELKQWDLAKNCFLGVLDKGGLSALAGTTTIDEMIAQKLAWLGRE